MKKVLGLLGLFVMLGFWVISSIVGGMVILTRIFNLPNLAAVGVVILVYLGTFPFIIWLDEKNVL